MTPDEFIKIMLDNSSDFPEFAAMSQEEQERVANQNINSGVAEAFYYPDGRLVAVGGVRFRGIGEAWMITPRDIQSHPDHTRRQAQFLDLLAQTQTQMLRMCNENDLWRIFATGTLSVKFLEQLGFKRADKMLVWSKT